jgi:FkbM family methyltransferase
MVYGIWTRSCIEIFPEAQYFCVDPLDENQPFLNQLSAEYQNVRCWQGCLGPKIGTTILNVDGAGSSILLGHWGNPYGIQREVVVETLDNLILKGICLQPDLIKLDVQGYELEVLRGAEGALRKTQAIIAEVSFFPFQTSMPVFHEVVRQLAEYGFAVYDILRLSLRPLDGAPAQTDMLFLKIGHPLRSNNKWAGNSVY